MLHNQKIIFVAIVDTKSKMVPNLDIRIWHHEKFVQNLLQTETCLMGKWTYGNTNWYGPKTWVLTSDQNWKGLGVGVVSDINDLHLHSEGPIYVLGGKSVFQQMSPFVDEIHLYVVNNKLGTEDWIDVDMRDWKPFDYVNENIWSYAHLKRKVESKSTKRKPREKF